MLNIEEIKEQFKKVIKYSQDIPEPNVDNLFKKWLEAKRDFIECMDGKLIYEWPEEVNFELNEYAKNNRINNFIETIQYDYGNEDLADFIEAQREGFFSNRVVENYFYKTFTIPKGMKIGKASKFFIKDANILNKFQIEMSMILQEDKIKGKLCLSVHPLDFLSSSETNHNWRSCHALNGEYRSGNLSYMVDSSTIMCYLKSDEDTILPDFPEDVPWNNKKWRVLLFFSENWDLLFAGRQYPLSTNQGLDFIREKVLPTIHMNHWSLWNDYKINSFDYKFSNENYRERVHFISPYIAVGNTLKAMNEIVINNPGSLQFNDLLSSSCYDPLYCYQLGEDYYSFLFSSSDEKKFTKILTKNKAKLKIGGAVKCLRCGKKDIEVPETMMCNDCELQYGDCNDETFADCPCCGNRFIYDEGVYVNQTGETVCPQCAEEEIRQCANCGDLYYKDDVRYVECMDNYFCDYCYEDLNLAEKEKKYN